MQAIGALLESIRADIQDLKAGQKDLQEQVERVRHSVVNIELEHLPKVSAALDGVVGSIQKDKEHNERICRFIHIVLNHEPR